MEISNVAIAKIKILFTVGFGPATASKLLKHAAITPREMSAGIKSNSINVAALKPDLGSALEVSVKKIHQSAKTMLSAKMKLTRPIPSSGLASLIPLTTPRTSSPKIMMVNKPNRSNILEERDNSSLSLCRINFAINGGV